MIELFPLVVLAFAAYRITRALIFDTWIEGIRQRWYNFLLGGKHLKLIREKALELTSCTFCTGFWVSIAVLAVYLGSWPWDFTAKEWLSGFAVAGLQALLHTLEPDD